MERRLQNSVIAALLVVAILVLPGCGQKRPPMRTVRGRVTLEGGAWPTKGWVNFTPLKQAGDLPQKPGTGHFDTDGKFVVKCGEYNGLIPGEYSMNLCCWEKPPAEGFEGLSYVPKKFTYSGTSGLTLTVPLDSTDDVYWEYDFPRAKPGGS